MRALRHQHFSKKLRKFTCVSLYSLRLFGEALYVGALVVSPIIVLLCVMVVGGGFGL